MYYLVTGAAGLGKTALVESVGRDMVAADGARFKSIVFVELRARNDLDSVNAAVEQAWRGAGLLGCEELRGALIILDNADDPYKGPSNRDTGWFEEQVLPQLEAHGPAALLVTVRDEGHRPLFLPIGKLRGAYRLQLEPLTPEAGIDMLNHLMQPEASQALDQAEQNQVLSACGSRGVSPLALSVVCGVLHHRMRTDVFFDRALFLNTLLEKMVDCDDDFKRVQDVMECSFRYLQREERVAFLKLHLFPDVFTLSEAAGLWGVDESVAKLLLKSMLGFNLVHLRHRGAHGGEHAFLVLDHIWVFATKHAEDPSSEWLSRPQYAHAVLHLIRLVIDRWPEGGVQPGSAELPRLFHAAVTAAHFIACTQARVARSALGALLSPPPVSLSPSPTFRSLSVPAYSERFGGAGPESRRCRHCPLGHEHVTAELTIAAQELVRLGGRIWGPFYGSLS
jgi:hypothetical protein